MTICRPQRKFILFYISCTPTTHDSLAWHSTDVGHNISIGELTDPFYLLGNSDFVTTRSTISAGATMTLTLNSALWRLA